MKFKRQYNIDGKFTDGDMLNSPEDLFVETYDLWKCDDFSFELQAWAENAKPGEVFEDDDIKVTACE